jgi:hypothetical protein
VQMLYMYPVWIMNTMLDDALNLSFWTGLVTYPLLSDPLVLDTDGCIGLLRPAA